MAERRRFDDPRFALRAAATLLLMTACALTMLAAALATLFRARRLYRERIATPFGRGVLALWGIRLELLPARPFPPGQAVYVSNHGSTLDMFVLLALGLPNTRFFLSGYLRRLPPLALIGWLMGIFWTVDQKFPEARRRIFRRAAAVLRRSGESVYLSPEGERVTGGVIGPFNKGAFHLATDLGAPIVPLFIAIPRAIDPGRGLRARPGTVRVYVKPAIPTRGWRLADLAANKDKVRRRFIRWNREHRS